MTTEVRAWLAQMWTRRNLERVVLLIIVSLIVIPPIWHVSHVQSDFSVHGRIALRLEEEGFPGDIPHFLYHLLIVAMSKVLPSHWILERTTLPVVLSLLALALLVYELLWRRVRDTPWQALALPLTVAFFLLEPVIINGEPPYWLGYIHVNIYHNPTYILMKIFALPVSLYALQAIAPSASFGKRHRVFPIGMSAALVILMSLTKPSYTIVLLPALIVAAAFQSLRRQRMDWWLLGLGIIGPAVVLLAIQYFIAYGSGDDTGIAFGLLHVIGLWEQMFGISRYELPLQVVLSILFPLVVYVLHLRQAILDPYLNLSWLAFLGGSFVLLGFYETGLRASDGNFGWTAYIALFILMFASVRFIIDQYRHVGIVELREHIPWPLVLVAFVFGLHVLSGIRYIVELMRWP
jgi:hypothetical protein